MSNCKLFYKTLKQIGYNDTKTLEEADMQLLFSDKKLTSFLEAFCSLNEDNVLTTEEIQEYLALTSDELSEIEAIQKSNEKLFKISIDEYKKIDCHCLQEQINLIENHNTNLERQIEYMKKYEDSLFQEKEVIQMQLLNAKKKFQIFELSVLPDAENQFVTSLQSVLKHIESLNALITQATILNSKTPELFSFEVAVQEYLKTEEKIMQCIKLFLDKNFQMEEKNNAFSFIMEENSENACLLNEALFLQKSLKNGLESKITSEAEVQKVETIVKYFSFDQVFRDLESHPLQLSEKLEDVIKENSKLKKRHEELNIYLLDATSKFVGEQFSKITESIERKTKNCLQYAIKEMFLPMNALLLQRARLEILISILLDHKKNNLEKIKLLIDNLLARLKQDLSILLDRIDHNAKDLVVEGLQQHEQNPEMSIYLSMYRILTTLHEANVQDLSTATMKDVLQRANKLSDTKEDLKKKHEEKLKIIELMEKHVDSVETLLSCSDPDYTNWHEAEHNQNADLNKLSIKLSSIETNLAECNKKLEHKEKLLQAKKNLSLARNLYIYALTDRGYFKECICNIKETVKNSTDY